MFLKKAERIVVGNKVLRQIYKLVPQILLKPRVVVHEFDKQEWETGSEMYYKTSTLLSLC